MSDIILRNAEGDVQRVSTESSDGRLRDLIDTGYDIAPESADVTISMLANDGNGQQSVDHVPARNIRAYLSEMERATGVQPVIITGDGDMQSYVRDVRDSAARAARVRELGTSWEGLGLGLLSGAVSPLLAVGRLAGAVDGDTQFFGADLGELSEARPGSQLLGNLAGLIGTGGAGAIAGVGVRGAQAAARAGVGRIGQVGARAAVEEGLFIGAQTLPLQALRENPELSAEALLAGGALGFGLGLVGSAVPLARSFRQGRTEVFPEVVGSAQGGGPFTRLIELGRNPTGRRAPNSLQEVTEQDVLDGMLSPEDLDSLLSLGILPGREALSLIHI